MIKLKSLLSESKILVPRRSPEEREKTHIAEHYRIIQRYIKDGCEGDLNLNRSPIKILPDNLTHVGGNLYLYDSKIEDLNNLERVDGSINLWGLGSISRLKTLGKLKYVGEALDLRDTNIETLGNLETVDGTLWISHIESLKSLGKLKRVNRSLDIDYTNIESLDNLEYVKGTLWLKNTPKLKSFGKLNQVDGNLYLYNSNILNRFSVSQIRQQIKVSGKIHIGPYI